jgi:hypothetical protein
MKDFYKKLKSNHHMDQGPRLTRVGLGPPQGLGLSSL